MAEFETSATVGQAPLAVEFTNLSLNADEFQWDFGDGETATTSAVDEPVTHEYTKAGTHEVTLTAARQGEPSVTNTATLTIEVSHGSLAKIAIGPTEVTLVVEETHVFSVETWDQYDNPIPEAELTWEIEDEVGTIAEDGTLTAGTKVGSFDEAVTVIARQDTFSTRATASVTINPGPVETVTIAPIDIAAGDTLQLEVVAADKYGNPVTEVEVVGAATWAVTDENAGSVTQGGLFRAGEVVGSHADVVEAQVSQEDRTETVVASVAIVPGPLEQVGIAPEFAEIGMGMTQQFVAVGADQYGNRIPGLDFAWSVEKEGGTIDANGLFTAGVEPGVYEHTVKASAIEGLYEFWVEVTVVVEPDRIAFISDREDDQTDIYLMDVDTGDVERLTSTPAVEFLCNWSPDGRRIVYDSIGLGDGILVMNDDGGWILQLIEHEVGGIYIYPSWSPDGTKIAFVKLTGSFDYLDLYVMDIDGGNVIQLTDTPDATEWVPAWSPDGTKLVYDFTPQDQRGDIYIINADGTGRKRLTSDPANDTGPVWSPDGTRIAFTSVRDGDYEIYVMNADGSNLRKLTSNSGITDVDPSWSPDGERIVFVSDRDTDDDTTEIYIMSADGRNVVRVTDNAASDSEPAWAPSKAGVEVTEASVIIADASALQAQTVQKVTSEARGAVVRIETDLGSGSGFIIDPNGLILTNNHVISDAEEITVFLEDGTDYSGTVQSRDLARDIAVVKIEATDLPYLEFGDLSQVALGQQVVVLGYPLGEEDVTLSSGFVSAIKFDSGRNITWVQTDSAINPGNSGGPLLNLQGQVIGVVSAKLVGFAIEGVGFAISANTVNTYLPQLVAEE
ncbi:MAG: trypsin-like peptidase domain-containing protein [Dehalococcoidia bacterium]